jgi:hypothetical protein
VGRASEEKRDRKRESYKIFLKSLQARTKRVKSDRFFNTTKLVVYPTIHYNPKK